MKTQKTIIAVSFIISIFLFVKFLNDVRPRYVIKKEIVEFNSQIQYSYFNKNLKKLKLVFFDIENEKKLPNDIIYLSRLPKKICFKQNPNSKTCEKSYDNVIDYFCQNKSCFIKTKHKIN